MNDLVGKGKERKQILTKKKYAVFTDIMSKPKSKKIVYLKLANSEEKNKDEKKEKLF